MSQGVYGFQLLAINGLTADGWLVATTNQISVPGDYYINATASVFADSGDAVYCYVATGAFGNFNDGLDGGFNNFVAKQYQFGQAAIADVWNVSAGYVINLYCFDTDNYPNSGVASALLTATLISVDNGETTSSLRSGSNPQLLDKKQIQNSPVNARLNAHR
jgi:hypothetical protein